METDWTKLSKKDLEKLVSCSQWNPTKNSDEVIREYIDKSLKSTNIARKKITNKLGVLYGSLPAESFDVFGLDLKDDSPIFVYVHGGYWQEGSKDISGGTGILNYEIGIKTVAFGYTLAPHAKIEEINQELRSALEVLIKMYSKAKIVLAGHSAGGQLVSNLLHTSLLSEQVAKSIAGIILISGVFDLRPLVPTYVNDALKMDGREAESLSSSLLPFNKIEGLEKVKVLVLVGGHDSPEFKRQSLSYYEKLKKQFGKNATYFESKDDDHFTIVQNLTEHNSIVRHRIQEFLKACAE